MLLELESLPGFVQVMGVGPLRGNEPAPSAGLLNLQKDVVLWGEH